MIQDFHKKFHKKIKMFSLVFFGILQLQHTVISYSEKLTHPTAHWQWRNSRHFRAISTPFSHQMLRKNLIKIATSWTIKVPLVIIKKH